MGVPSFLITAPWLVAAALLTACNPPGATTEPGVSGVPSGGQEPSAGQDPSAGNPPTASAHPDDAWLITATGIGPIKVGEPIPATMRTPEQYSLRLYGDLQPLEGFWIDEAAVFAALATGPYHRRVERGEIEPPPASTLAGDAVEDAKNTPIALTYAESARAHTQEGVRVGTRYEDFIGVYPDATVGPYPTLFEEPTCMGAVPGTPSVHFFFDTCGDDAGPPASAVIIRIAVL